VTQQRRGSHRKGSIYKEKRKISRGEDNFKERQNLRDMHNFNYTTFNFKIYIYTYHTFIKQEYSNFSIERIHFNGHYANMHQIIHCKINKYMYINHNSQ